HNHNLLKSRLEGGAPAASSGRFAADIPAASPPTFRPLRRRHNHNLLKSRLEGGAPAASSGRFVRPLRPAASPSTFRPLRRRHSGRLAADTLAAC
ncbi:MAG TPA: hypothetical protein PKZ32_14480, partial [Candidatus Melainabacteria bacterium]|nr:hypothetical protein [Candidatus Melainabacteria bacterium]